MVRLGKSREEIVKIQVKFMAVIQQTAILSPLRGGLMQ